MIFYYFIWCLWRKGAFSPYNPRKAWWKSICDSIMLVFYSPIMAISHFSSHHDYFSQSNHGHIAFLISPWLFLTVQSWPYHISYLTMIISQIQSMFIFHFLFSPWFFLTVIMEIPAFFSLPWCFLLLNHGNNLFHYFSMLICLHTIMENQSLLPFPWTVPQKLHGIPTSSPFSLNCSVKTSWNYIPSAFFHVFHV